MPPTLNISPSALIPTNISPPSSAEILSIPQFTFYPDALDLAESRLKDKSSSLTESDLVKLANRFKAKHNNNDKRTENGKITKISKIEKSVQNPRFRRSTPGVKTVEKLEEKLEEKVMISETKKTVKPEKQEDENSETVFEIMDEQHYIRTLELYGANGYNLEMKSSGIVKAERRNTKFGMLEFITLATSLITIRSPETGEFLSMKRSGEIYSSPNLTADAVFYEHIESNHFTTFTSAKHIRKNRDCLLSINKRGRVKRSCKRRARRHKAASFLVF